MKSRNAAAHLNTMADVSFLATVEGDQPRSRAMTHYIDPDGTIWYPTLLNTGKVRQIEKNPSVAVSFFNSRGQAPPVTVYGTAEIITDPDSTIKLWTCYDPSIKHIVPEGPDSANFAFIKISPHSIVNNTYR